LEDFLKKYLIIIFSLYSLKSNSGLLLEPYAGLDNGSQDVSWFGLEIGGRIGWVWDIFMVGADIDAKNVNVEYEDFNYDEDTKISNRGVFAGWMWEDWALRLKYYFDSDWRLDNRQNFSGDGFGLDGAYRISKHFSINLELTRIILDNDLEAYDVLFSVSLPFDLVTR